MLWAVEETSIMPVNAKSDSTKALEQSRMKLRDEGLVLRNFKQEFDAVVSQFGLGPAVPSRARETTTANNAINK